MATAENSEIQPGSIYCLADFLRRVNWSRHAWRSARDAGMRGVKMHGRCYVRADDFLRYANQVASKQTEQAAAQGDA